MCLLEQEIDCREKEEMKKDECIARGVRKEERKERNTDNQ